MKFLVDNQLPVALARMLSSLGFEAQHVFDVGLANSKDSDIWDFSVDGGWVLISKDEDFPRLAREHEDPIQVVWVRLGNCRNPVLLETFQKIMPTLFDALEAGERIIEIR